MFFSHLDWLFFDVRSALRVLARDRLFAAGVILVLGLGLGVNTTIFTIVNGMTWRPLPVAHGERIVNIDSRHLQRGVGTYTSYADFQDWRGATQTLEDLAAYRTATMNIGDDGRPADRLAGTFVTSNTFRLLGMQPALGRDFVQADDEPEADAVIILGHDVWRARYGADPTIVGRTLRINGAPTVVLGVMPAGFQFPSRANAWRPVSQMPGLDTIDRAERQFDLVGRLRPDVPVAQASAELDGIAAALAARYPDTNADIGARVVPFTHAFVAPPPEAREPLVMLIAAAIVLLIACANGANLLLARAAHRAREMAMRATLGASRLRIVRQLVVEALVIAVAAAGLGLLLSAGGVAIFTRETVDLNLPYWIAFEFDARVFTYVAAACLGTAILFGVAPAWHLSKAGTHDVLKDGGRGAVGVRRVGRWTGALLVSELALTLTLLGAAAILLRSSASLGRQDALLDLDDIVTAQIGLPAARYEAPERRHQLHAQVQERFDHAPGIQFATLASVRPFIESSTRVLQIEGQPPPASGRLPSVQSVGVGRRYFDTLGLYITRGRALQPGDDMPGREAVVINQQLADVYFPHTDPVGRRIRLTETREAGTNERWLTIVGVVPSIRQRTMAGVAPLAYVPLDLHLGPTLAVIARHGGDTSRTIAELREALRAVDSDVALFNVNSLRRLSELSRWPARMVTFVLALFAVIAIALSIAGLYAMTAYGVSRRTAEIGLRMALGARRAQIAWWFLRTTLFHVGAGLALGMAGVMATAQLLRGMLVETSGPDALLLTGIVAAVVMITVVACLVPARRAVRLDPVVALRHE